MGVTNIGNNIRNLDAITEKLGEEVNYTESVVKNEENVIGTVINGMFNEIEFTRALLNNIRQSKGLESIESKVGSFKEFKENEYDKLADFLYYYLC